MNSSSKGRSNSAFVNLKFHLLGENSVSFIQWQIQLQSYQREFEEDFIHRDIQLEQASVETKANKL